MSTAAFAHDAFLVEHDADAPHYRVRPLGPDDEPGPAVAVGAPAPGPRTPGEAVRIGPRLPDPLGARYEVTGPGGERIALLVHRTRATLLRATWAVHDAGDGHMVAWVREDRPRTALARRVRDRLRPGTPSRTTGSFTILSGQRPIGAIAPSGAGGRDRRVHLRGDAERTLDRRAAVALAVALDERGRR